MDAPAVWFVYLPDRKSEHPANHLARFRGRLQADAFPGFNRLYEPGGIMEIASPRDRQTNFIAGKPTHLTLPCNFYGLAEAKVRNS